MSLLEYSQTTKSFGLGQVKAGDVLGGSVVVVVAETDATSNIFVNDQHHVYTCQVYTFKVAFKRF